MPEITDNEMVLVELPSRLPCPFCGKEPSFDHTRSDGVRFSCLECEEAAFEDFIDAAKFWNTRAAAAVAEVPLGGRNRVSRTSPVGDGSLPIPPADAEPSRIDAAAFLREAATYFGGRPTGGEDSAFWANVANASMCRRIARMIDGERNGV